MCRASGQPQPSRLSIALDVLPQPVVKRSCRCRKDLLEELELGTVENAVSLGPGRPGGGVFTQGIWDIKMKRLG